MAHSTEPAPQREAVASRPSPHPDLHNADLAPLAPQERRWGWFPFFNVWSNDIQSLAGYTLAAGLFVTAGISGWWVFAAIVLAGLVVNALVNMTGRPAVEHGVPYPVLARAAMGVRGAQVPAMIRGVVAIFWFGAQTYFASTAMALALYALTGTDADAQPTFLGLTPVDWAGYVVVAVLQLLLFTRGIATIERFLNVAGPAVYLVMVALLVAIWVQAGDQLLPAVGSLFAGGQSTGVALVAAFVGVVGTMIAYFSAVIINFGDFARFSKDQRSMRVGNFTGLPVSLAFFTVLALFITTGSYLVFQGGTGEPEVNPAAIVGLVDSTALTVVAALTFLAATLGINLVANFIPPAFDLANLSPGHISFRTGGYITAGVGFVIGALWVAFIDEVGFPVFVDTLGAVLAPLFGVLVADYYVLRRQVLVVDELFSMDPAGRYHYTRGWNVRALVAVAVAGVFSVSAVWVPALALLSGFAWIIGAVLGAALYLVAMRGRAPQPAAVSAQAR
ncbi:NCS1 family nucleobase:cation symporter-1 [Pseudokineococcus sp. 1T1Z-3]|uniref:NCS1 family nucleobase:cation symporter-1 n=1 Tax=Pseudokineococcus sp. 1T1Z-3 TaxID=3132745 RepID=UPI0030A7EF46